MLFRLLHRLLLQRLATRSAGLRTRGSEVFPVPAPATRRGQPLFTKRRLIGVIALASVLGAVTIQLGRWPHKSTHSTAAFNLTIDSVSSPPLVVYLEGGALEGMEEVPEPSTSARITSVNSAFVPKFQVASSTTPIVVDNRDLLAHNTHVFNLALGGTVFNVALPLRGIAVSKVLNGTGIFRVGCDLHPWMQAWIFSPSNPHYAVLREPGPVRFTDLPPGRYFLHTWQAGRPEKVHSFSLASGEIKTLHVR